MIVVFGRVLLRPLFRLVASAGHDELFIAATLFVIVGAGVAAAVAGLSMALGAFVAGLLLAETEFRKAIETTIDPFKGLLLGMFFFTVGMNIDFREVVREPVLLLGGVVGLIAMKALLLTGSPGCFACHGRWRSRPACCSARAASSPSSASAWPSPRADRCGVSSFALAVTSVTMVLTPHCRIVARRLSRRLRDDRALDPELAVRPGSGNGRRSSSATAASARWCARCCDRHEFRTSPSTRMPRAVPEHAAKVGRRSFTATPPMREFLESCGLIEAAGRHRHDSLAQQHRPGRRARPRDAARHHGVSRARDAEHARHLYGIGVTDAVPETIEASLQLRRRR